jgi:hypothetical protein
MNRANVLLIRCFGSLRHWHVSIGHVLSDALAPAAQ